ncbi:MAG: DUF4465 domain-containing protein [Bacteroidetes bacterium]|nr:DUF4465 domain-containing protein [Bacteroidota bacterium]
MRKLLLSFLAVTMALAASAQYYIASFDTLHLSQPDTFYLNYTMPMQDVGFNDGGAHFPCIYDTAFGGSWDHGFAYSNMTDSVTSGYFNQYSAKTAVGYNSSPNYAVAWCSQYASAPTRIIFPISPDTVLGFYITNSTFAYNSMRDGDAFAKKFGGISGNDPDWFMLTVKGYHNGSFVADSVNFYLADFRSANNANDSIIKTWHWLSLSSLGQVDSLEFRLNSSDTVGGNGMNTPAYFCMDNLITKINPIHVNEVNKMSFAAKMYPNPATDILYIDQADQNITTISVLDASGKQVYTQTVTTKLLQINTASLNAGIYFVQMQAGDKTATARFIKQ